MVDLHLHQISLSNSTYFSANRRISVAVSAPFIVEFVQFVPDRHCRSFTSGTAVLPALPVPCQRHCRPPPSPRGLVASAHLRPATLARARRKRSSTRRPTPLQLGPRASSPTSPSAARAAQASPTTGRASLQAASNARPTQLLPPACKSAQPPTPIAASPLLLSAGSTSNRLRHTRPAAQAAAPPSAARIRKLQARRLQPLRPHAPRLHAKLPLNPLYPAVPAQTPRQCRPDHPGSAAQHTPAVPAIGCFSFAPF
jgi:hypothetical protein